MNFIKLKINVFKVIITNSIILFCLGSFAQQISFESKISVELNASEISSLKISSIHNRQSFNHLVLTNFDHLVKTGINGNSCHLFEGGTGRLKNGTNDLIVELITSNRTICDTIPLILDNSIKKTKLECLIGVRDSNIYFKKFLIKKIKKSASDFRLVIDKTEINKPLLLKLENFSEDTLFGIGPQNYFIGVVREMISYGSEDELIGFVSVSNEEFCTADSLNENYQKYLPPLGYTFCFAVQQDSCEIFIPKRKGNYLFDIEITKSPFENSTDESVFHQMINLKTVEIYTIQCEFQIR